MASLEGVGEGGWGVAYPKIYGRPRHFGKNRRGHCSILLTRPLSGVTNMNSNQSPYKSLRRCNDKTTKTNPTKSSQTYLYQHYLSHLSDCVLALFNQPLMRPRAIQPRNTLGMRMQVNWYHYLNQWLRLDKLHLSSSILTRRILRSKQHKFRMSFNCFLNLGNKQLAVVV